MTRLTKAMCESIVKRTLDAGRLAREAAITRGERSLALRLTRHRYGDDVFDRCRALPAGWLEVHRTISFGWSNALNFPQKCKIIYVRSVKDRVMVPVAHRIELDTAVPLPNSFQNPWDRSHLGIMYDEVYDHFASIVALHDEMEQLETQIKGVLTAFTTVEKLAADWPEGYSHLPQEMLLGTGSSFPVPAPRIEDLNDRLVAFAREAA